LGRSILPSRLAVSAACASIGWWLDQKVAQALALAISIGFARSAINVPRRAWRFSGSSMP